VTFPFAEAFILPNGGIIGKKNSILDIFKTNPTATIPDVRTLTGKSQRTISRELRAYQDIGLLRREGARKNGRWVVQ
jgi:predicted HTH transcriptional regulator